MSETISAAIFTSTLFVLAILLTSSFMIILNFSIVDSTRTRMNDVANYVASNIADLVSLCYISTSEKLFLIKTVEVPSQINGYGYTIRLIVDNNTYKVVISSSYSFVSGEASLWKAKAEGSLSIYNQNEIVYEQKMFKVFYLNEVPSGMQRFSVFALKVNNSISFGIGIIKS